MVPAGEALQHQTAREQIRTYAAVLLRHRDAEVAVASQFGKGGRGPPFLRIHARCQRIQFAPAVLTGGLEGCRLLGAQIERG